MRMMSSLLLAGTLVLGATSMAAAQNYTPSLGLPNGSYLPPIDNPYFEQAYPASPNFAGRSVYRYRDRRFVQPYRGYTSDEE